MRIREIILSEVSDKVKQQVAARWKQENTALTDENINYYLNLWDRFAKTFPVEKRDITRLQFTEVESLIDAAVSRQKMKGKAKPRTEKNPAEAIYNKNNLEIYKGDLREKCILYGKGYSWCISRTDSSNLFYSYRMRANEPIFYFVFDLDRPQNDPWHAVVIYVDKNNTYTVATAINTGDEEMTWNEIIRSHPKLNGLQNIFQPQPLSSQEREDHKKFSKPVDLDQYQQYNIDEKYKYIMFGNKLTDEQQDVTPDELIGTYAKQQLFHISKKTWYSRLSAGDRRKVEQDQIAFFGTADDFWDSPGHHIEYIFARGIMPSDEVMAAAVKNGTIKYIFDAGITPSDEVLMTAVKSSNMAIDDIIKAGITPTDELLMTAVKSNGWAISYILSAGIRPTEEMLMAAVKSKGTAIEPILKAGYKPTEEMLMTAMKSDKSAIEPILKAGYKPTEEMLMTGIKSDGRLIKLIIEAGIKPTEEMILTALKKSPNSLEFVLKSDLDFKPTEEMMKAFVIYNWRGLHELFDSGIKPSKEVIMASIKNHPFSLGVLLNKKLKHGYKPTEEMLMTAVKLEGKIIRNILDAGIKPTEEMMIAAVKSNDRAIKYIFDAGITPSDEVLITAARKNKESSKEANDITGIIKRELFKRGLL